MHADDPLSSTLVTVFAMCGKFGIGSAFAVIWLYSMELFPTPVRSIGTGYSSAFARLGAVVAPQIGLLVSETE